MNHFETKLSGAGVYDRVCFVNELYIVVSLWTLVAHLQSYDQSSSSSKSAA